MTACNLRSNMHDIIIIINNIVLCITVIIIIIITIFSSNHDRRDLTETRIYERTWGFTVSCKCVRKHILCFESKEFSEGTYQTYLMYHKNFHKPKHFYVCHTSQILFALPKYMKCKYYSIK